ncbi:hypothetical protein K505DRAFT_342657 [Melanomma pulvis-pyrius CBS 109.77]|uniref:Essential protein Yae1 N-terminal domain-containing protein n=1 Tax=Melanomma pulvis-pyrius CBS 109.77 TaxID=1314802 RepID=A0A6A6WU82_9PLEO|nr:hypothetical protein K505DRAFT_342657 [Melanomma pulvis-pyrius CBS 109.77]
MSSTELSSAWDPLCKEDNGVEGKTIGVGMFTHGTSIPIKSIRTQDGETDFLQAAETRVEWASTHMDELWMAKWDAEKKMVMSRKRDADALSDLRTKLKLSDSDCSYLRRTQAWHSDQTRAVKKSCDTEIEKMKYKMEDLEHREHKLVEGEAELKRSQSDFKGYRDYNAAIKNLGDRIEKATAEMKILVSGKPRAGQSFEKWEKSNCRPEMRLVEFTSRVENERKKIQTEHAAEMKVIEDLKNQVEEMATKNKNAAEELVTDRLTLAEEQEQWRLSRTRDLGGIELDSILETRIRQELGQIKIELREDAFTDCYAFAKEDLDQLKPNLIAEGYVDGYDQGREEGYDQGYENGHVVGFKEGIDEGHTKGFEEGVEYGHSEGYKDGHADDHQSNYTQGHDEGYKEDFSYGQPENKDEHYADGYDAGREVSHDISIKESYEEGYKEGRSKGYRVGNDDGYDEGYEECESRGREKGRKRGYDRGYNKGYDEGYGEGYDNGYQDGDKNGFRSGHEFAARKLKAECIDREFAAYHEAMCAKGGKVMNPVHLKPFHFQKAHHDSKDPYWKGRALMEYLHKSDLTHDTKSRWYKSYETSHNLYLKGSKFQNNGYFRGIEDGWDV